MIFLDYCFRFKVSLFLLSIFIIGCTQTDEAIPEHIKNLANLTVYPGDIRPAMEIRLVREHPIGHTDQKATGRLGRIAVDMENRVYIEDLDLHTIHIFSSNGSHVTSLGNEGRGPGEFEFGPWPFIATDRLFAVDPMQYRMTVFSLDSLNSIREIVLNLNITEETDRIAALPLQQLQIINDERFLASFDPLLTEKPTLPGQSIELTRQHFLLNSDGKMTSDKIPEQRGRITLTAKIDGQIQSATNFSFLGKPLDAVSREGDLFMAWSEDFLIKVYDIRGTYKYAFYHPYPNVILTRESAVNDQVRRLSDLGLPSVVDYRRQMILQNDLPKSWPALETMFADDEMRLWVATINENFEVYEWWILEKTGELITRFAWPRDEPIEIVKNGYMYTRETDPESGLQQVIRYRIELEEL